MKRNNDNNNNNNKSNYNNKNINTSALDIFQLVFFIITELFHLNC